MKLCQTMGDKLMKIIAVERKKSGRLKISLDNGSNFEILEQEFKKFNFGNEISTSQYNFIMENIVFKEARDIALKYLSSSAKSIAQIKNKLSNYPKEIVKKVLDLLIEYHYADDELFAKNYIYDCLTLKYYGKMKIIFDLRQKKIDNEIINTAVEKYIDNEKEIESAKEIAMLKFKSFDEKSIIKLKNMLYRRGFSYNIIDEVIKKLIAD